MAVNDPIQEKLRELRDTYARQLPDRLNTISALWSELQDHWDLQQQKELHRLVHSIAGSGLTFGCSKLGQHARHIEQLIQDAGSESLVDISLQTRLGNMIKELRGYGEKQDAIMNNTNEVATNPLTESSPVVYIIEDDAGLASTLQIPLQQNGYTVEIFPSLSAAQDSLYDRIPNVLMIDISLTEGELAGATFANQLQQAQIIPIPVIFTSRRNDIHARLEAIRAGGDAFLSKPIDAKILLDTLDNLTASKNRSPYRILIVDDDQDLANHYALVLKSAHMEAHTVTRPLEIIKALADINPDLILMDIYMPECSGTELAKVIRQEGAYISLPIVFLSSEENLEKQYAALKIGGDDFLTKPIPDNHLINAVHVRAQRARQIASLISRDSLTGLINHTKIKEQLQQDILRSARDHKPLVFALLDIDHFKTINDNHGHLIGDKVLIALSRVLQAELRKTDVVGRYGGEEFAVIFSDTTVSRASIIMNRVREKFANTVHHADGYTFHVTFSAGLSFFPKHNDCDSLIASADKAMYRAKESGRNKVIEAEA